MSTKSHITLTAGFEHGKKHAKVGYTLFGGWFVTTQCYFYGQITNPTLAKIYRKGYVRGYRSARGNTCYLGQGESTARRASLEAV